MIDVFVGRFMRLAALVGWLVCSSGCMMLMRVPADQVWSAKVVEPQVAHSFKSESEPWASEYALVVLTDAKGFDFSSAQRFLRTLHKHPNGGKRDHSVGHSWLLLISPEQWVEGGHTGEFGIDSDQYYQGVYRLTARQDPNPIRYLQTRMDDGEFQIGPGSHTPTFAARIELTKAQHDLVLRHINVYDYREFAVTDRQCTDFIAGALNAIGIPVANRMELLVPQQVKVGFKKVTLWTNPEYQRLTLGFPDVLQQQMKGLVDNAIASDVTDWYLSD